VSLAPNAVTADAGTADAVTADAVTADAGRPRWVLVLAWGWLLLVVLLGASIPYRLQKTGGFDSSLVSLLPSSDEDRQAADITRRFADATTAQLVFLVGHSDFDAAARAADACEAELRKASAWLATAPRIEPGALGQAIELLRPFRAGLLTPADSLALEQGGAQLAERALSELYQPFGSAQLLPITEDPLGLTSHFLMQRGLGSGVTLREGRLVLERDGLTWIVLPAELHADALSFAAQGALAPVLGEAAAAARRAGAREVLRSGFIFHAARAATRANWEMSTIGLGSLLGVIFLIWLPFRSLRPVLLVLLPIGVGTLLALSVDLWLFQRVHLLTLVFGSSIVGVAEDYGVHFVCGALEPGTFRPWRYLRHIARGLWLALLTTLVGYVALAALPFPGLRQMGTFGAVGLVGGWVTTMLWLPFLSRRLGAPRGARLVPALMRVESRWPRLARRRWLQLALAGSLLLALFGFSRARSVDDVRALYDSAPELSREDDKVRELLGVAAAGQFFVVRGASAEQVLQREEALVRVLGAEQAAQRLDGWQALSDAIPSLERQRHNRELVRRVAYDPGGLAERVFSVLDDSDALARARADFTAHERPLSLSDWLASPLSARERPLWLGTPQQAASVVLLQDGHAPLQLAALKRATADLPGVLLVDPILGIAQVLGRFRRTLSWFLPLGYLGVALCLSRFYGKQAWRVACPAAIASLWAVGVPALWGQAVTLFDLLALVLVLGIGIDYGIFMNERRGPGFSVAFLSVSLGAASTLLSFGLLATSGTPALADFGLTLLIGIGGSWCLTPCFVSPTQAVSPPLPEAAGLLPDSAGASASMART
jgi:predicted exporter